MAINNMKTNHWKKIGIAVAMLIAISALGYKLLPIQTTHDPVATKDQDTITDIFYGSVEKMVEDSDLKQPGTRYMVKIIKNSKYPQQGNAQGMVVVNNLTGIALRSGLDGPGYIFYTKYNTQYHWYDVIKVQTIMPIGEQ